MLVLKIITFVLGARETAKLFLQKIRGFDSGKQSNGSLMIPQSFEDFFLQKKEPHRLQLADN
jgi:hypothetical protein